MATMLVSAVYWQLTEQLVDKPTGWKSVNKQDIIWANAFEYIA